MIDSRNNRTQQAQEHSIYVTLDQNGYLPNQRFKPFWSSLHQYEPVLSILNRFYPVWIGFIKPEPVLSSFDRFHPA